MSIFSRLKRLWEITSDNETDTFELEIDTPTKQKALATIVQDDPLEIFPSETEDDTTDK